MFMISCLYIWKFKRRKRWNWVFRAAWCLSFLTSYFIVQMSTQQYNSRYAVYVSESGIYALDYHIKYTFFRLRNVSAAVWFCKLQSWLCIHLHCKLYSIKSIDILLSCQNFQLLHFYALILNLMPVTHIIKAETTWSLMLNNKTSHIQWSWLAGQQSHDWLWNPRQTIQQFVKHLNVKCWKLLLLICSQKNLWKRRDGCVTVIFKINSDQIFSVLKQSVSQSDKTPH